VCVEVAKVCEVVAARGGGGEPAASRRLGPLLFGHIDDTNAWTNGHSVRNNFAFNFAFIFISMNLKDGGIRIENIEYHPHNAPIYSAPSLLT